MSWDEVGKQAKQAGIQSHRDRRHLDPTPPPSKVPGKAKPGAKVRKVFGFTYQRRWKGFNYKDMGKWKRVTHFCWYATEKQRDDAMRSGGGVRAYCETRDFQPIRRV